jgi:hypothetical protein
MDTVVGLFTSLDKAQAAINQLKSLGISDKRLVLLTPGSDDILDVRTVDAEPPGIGAALGGTVGGAMGVAGGFGLGAAAASLLIPGVGPVIAGGVLAAAILGLGGATAGAAVGENLEENIDVGLPQDEVFIYEDALRKGRTVVLAFVEDPEQADRARNVLAQAGAESIDAAREDWWLGLRDAEEENYQTRGRDFKSDEVSYRCGFEAALNRQYRGKSYEEVAGPLRKRYEIGSSDEAFRCGYDRGCDYQKKLEIGSSGEGSAAKPRSAGGHSGD